MKVHVKCDRYKTELATTQSRAESKISKVEKDLRTKDKRIQHLEKKVCQPLPIHAFLVLTVVK